MSDIYHLNKFYPFYLCVKLYQSLNRIVSIFLISLLVFPSLKKFMIFTDFQWNRLDISNEFCENVKTDANCKGTCHLVKEIKKESNEKKKTPFSTINSSKIELFFTEKKMNNKIFFLKDPSYFFTIESGYNSLLNQVFRPPQKA